MAITLHLSKCFFFSLKMKIASKFNASIQTISQLTEKVNSNKSRWIQAYYIRLG